MICYALKILIRKQAQAPTRGVAGMKHLTSQTYPRRLLRCGRVENVYLESMLARVMPMPRAKDRLRLRRAVPHFFQVPSAKPSSEKVLIVVCNCYLYKGHLYGKFGDATASVATFVGDTFFALCQPGTDKVDVRAHCQCAELALCRPRLCCDGIIRFRFVPSRTLAHL